LRRPVKPETGLISAGLNRFDLYKFLLYSSQSRESDPFESRNLVY